jgi:hypothetical protein
MIDGKTFSIGQNLFDFLATTRTKATSDVFTYLGPYWIDALCINQSNVVERNHQVRQMGVIYSKAVRVDVWLGLTTWDPTTPFRGLQEVIMTYDNWLNLWNYKVELIQSINDNPYWTRAWIIQEVALAQKVTIRLGTASVDMQRLVDLLGYIGSDDHGMSTSTLFRLADIREIGVSKTETLLHLLEKFPDKQCSDPRDRIYSLLSMTNGDFSNLQVNYNISRVELAAQVLTRSGNSLCLCTALLVAQILGLRHQESSDRENHLRSQLCLEFCVVDHLPKRHFVKPSEKLVLCGESRYPKLYFLRNMYI